MAELITESGHVDEVLVGRGEGERGSLKYLGLSPRPHVCPSNKQSVEPSQLSWAYSQNVVRTNDIARSHN